MVAYIVDMAKDQKTAAEILPKNVVMFPRMVSKDMFALRILRRIMGHLQQQGLKDGKWQDKNVAVAWVEVHECYCEFLGFDTPKKKRKRPLPSGDVIV